MSRRVICSLGLVLIFLSVFGTAACASDDDSPWQLNLYMNIWGLGLGAGYDSFALLPEAKTTLYGSLCVTYEDWGFYRNPGNTLYTPGSGTDLGVFKRLDYVWSLGVIQDLPLGDGPEYPCEAFAFYKGRYDKNLLDASPIGSLIFVSGLPDAEGIMQHSFLAGTAYDSLTEDKELWTKRGYRAEVSCAVGTGDA